MKKLVFIVILMFSLALVISLNLKPAKITSAFIIGSSPNYKIRGEITEGGHFNLTYVSGGFILNVSKIVVGQTVAGIVNNTTANLKMCLGYLCSYSVYETEYSMNFTGKLSYSNGTVLKYSPVKIIINYQDYQFEGQNWTDVDGNFSIKIVNLPEIIIDKDLDVTFKVQSEIEASYACWYNHLTENCCKKPVTGPC